MAYRFKLGDDFYIARSRHTGDWALHERNKAYDYYAVTLYMGQKLTIENIDQVCVETGYPPGFVKKVIETAVREGGAGMLPRPDFTFTNDVQL